MISPEQARAARAILVWKQSDLAHTAEISVTAVNYFEREIGNTRSDTITAIEGAFEQAGIEFIAEGGVRRKQDGFKFLNYRGADFLSRLNEDMYRALYKGGAECVTCSADEAAWNRYAPVNNQELGYPVDSTTHYI